MKNKFDLIHSWLEMISTAKTVFGLTTLFVTLFAMAFTSTAQADDVLIFFNNDPQQAISHHDGALINHNSKLLAEEIKKINPELNVRLEGISDLRQAAQVMEQAQEKIRGIVFVGHGNQHKFALNMRHMAGGWEMAELMRYIPRGKVADRLTFYFHGCEMAKDQGQTNFQKEFTKHLMSKLPEKRRSSVDVIAHTSMSAYKSFKEPNAIHKASYKSGLGRWLENITISKGMVMPNLLALVGTTGAAHLYGVDHTSLVQVGGATLAAIFAKAYVEGGISKYGTQMTHKTEVKQSISTLLRTSFQADQCQAIFRLKPI